MGTRLLSYFLPDNVPLYDFVSNFGRFIILVVVPLGIIRFLEGQSIVERLGLQSWKYLGLIVLATISIAWVSFFKSIMSDPYLAFFTIVLAPIPEELFFRGFMFGEFKTRQSLKSTKLLIFYSVSSSIAFGLSHFEQGLDGVFWASIFGFVLALLYWVTGSILSTAAIHTIYNLFISLRTDSWMPTNFLLEIRVILLLITSLTIYMKRHKKP